MRKITVNGDIELRELSEDEIMPIFTTIDQQREYLRVWLPFVDFTLSPQNIEDFVTSSIKKAEKNGEFNTAIYYKGKFAGLVGFKDIDNLNKRTEIGYWLSQPFQGKGIITPSCKALIDYGFNELNLHRIQIRVAKDNKKSMKIPERLGFKVEGIERDGELLINGYTDIIVFSLLKTDKE